MTRAILVVEDEPVNRAVLRRFLSSKGFDAIETQSAEEALALLERRAFGAILLDNVLPGMTGLQALHEFVARSAAPVLMMTGHADEELERDARLLGARTLLHKPFDFELLARAIEEAIGRKATR